MNNESEKSNRKMGDLGRRSGKVRKRYEEVGTI